MSPPEPAAVSIHTAKRCPHSRHRTSCRAYPRKFPSICSSGAVAESTGAKVLTFTSCHNLTKDEFQSGATYISLMEGNLQNLREALN